jgi:transposase
MARQRQAATLSWEQLELQMTWREQRAYETIRPVVLYGDSAEERAQITGESVRTIYRHLSRFAAKGFAGLLEAAYPTRARTLPLPVRQLIVTLHADYPAFKVNEIMRICQAQLDYRPGARTVQRVIAESPPPPDHRRRFPLFRQMTVTAQRMAIIRLHLEGWPTKSIAGYLQTSRQTVHRIVMRFKQEDLAALMPRSRAPRRRIRKVTLRTLLQIQTLRSNPLLGAFRIRAALKQKYGTRLSTRTVARIVAEQRVTEREKKPATSASTPQTMPYAATRPHEYWSVDIRYFDMHTLGGGMIYCISIIDNYSRAVLASIVTRVQNLTAYLMVLFMAIRNHGAPEGLVSDGGAVFKAKRAETIYQTLGILKHRIDPGEPWQNYIETTFGIQRRMADYHLAQATTWTELLDAHAQWVADYNFQDHWAHRDRPNGRTSPFQVLAWRHGRIFREADLRHVFYALQYRRRVDWAGYIRFRHWRIYAEEGIAGATVALWLYDESLTVVCADEALAAYTVAYQPDATHFTRITNPQIFETTHRSRQLRLWDLTDDEWRKVYRLPIHPRRRSPVQDALEQTSLPLEMTG